MNCITLQQNNAFYLLGNFNATCIKKLKLCHAAKICVAMCSIVQYMFYCYFIHSSNRNYFNMAFECVCRDIDAFIRKQQH